MEKTESSENGKDEIISIRELVNQKLNGFQEFVTGNLPPGPFREDLLMLCKLDVDALIIQTRQNLAPRRSDLYCYLGDLAESYGLAIATFPKIVIDKAIRYLQFFISIVDELELTTDDSGV